MRCELPPQPPSLMRKSFSFSLLLGLFSGLWWLGSDSNPSRLQPAGSPSPAATPAAGQDSELTLEPRSPAEASLLRVESSEPESGSQTRARVDPAASRGVTEGLLVDAKSGVPIPNAPLEILCEFSDSPAIQRRLVTSDEVGRIGFDLPLVDVFSLRSSEKAVTTRLADSPLPEPDSNEQVWKIKADAFPTLRFDLEGAEDLKPADLTFWLIEDQGAQAPHRLALLTYAEFPLAHGAGSQAAPVARDTISWWTRIDLEQGLAPSISPSFLSTEGGAFSGQFWLAVAEQNGHRLGVLPYSQINNPDPNARLQFRMSPTGTVVLEPEFEQPPSGGFADRASAILDLAPVAPLGPDYPWQFCLDERMWLRPGRYTVTGSSKYHETLREEIDVPGGVTTTWEGLIRLAAGLRTVTVTARDENGRPLGDFRLILSLADSGSDSWIVSNPFPYTPYLLSTVGYEIKEMIFLELDNEGQRTASIPNFPPGDLGIEIDSSSAPLDISTFQYPNGDVLVEVLQVENLSLGIGFRSETSGLWDPFGSPFWTPKDPFSFERSSRPSVRIRLAGEPETERYTVVPNAISVPLDPRTRAFEWELAVGPYRILGDHTDFVSEESGRFFAEVKAPEGWVGEFTFTTAEGTPVEEARLWLDNEVVATTNALGRILARLSQAPRSARLEREGETLWNFQAEVKGPEEARVLHTTSLGGGLRTLLEMRAGGWIDIVLDPAR